MSMKDRLGRVTQRAKDVGSQIKEEAAGARDDAVSAAQAGADSVKGAVADRAASSKDRAASLIGGLDDIDFEQIVQRLPVPEAPVAQPWRFSIDKVITAGNKPPTGTGILLKQLDRVGAIDIGPDEVGFEGDTAKWSKVRGFRTRSLDGMIENLASEGVVDRVAGFLQPVPGRGWVAGKAADVLFTFWALLSDLALRDPEAARRQYVCEIEYKGWIRTKEAATGFFTGPCMALVPGLDDLFRAEADRHGVPIESIESSGFEDAERRAAWLHEKQAAILSRRERTREEIDDQSGWVSPG